MIKRISAVCILVSWLVGCSGTYVARSPRGVFVTRGDTTKAYAPVACLEAGRLNFYFLGISSLMIASPEAEDQLDDIVNQMLVPKAKALGADGIICLEYNTQIPYFPMSFYWEEARGQAIKFQ